MRSRLADFAADMITTQPSANFSMKIYERELAEWLRGDQMRFNTLVRFLVSRIEDRAQASAPSNPHESTRKEAMDSECRQIVASLQNIHLSPVLTDDAEES